MYRYLLKRDINIISCRKNVVVKHNSLTSSFLCSTFWYLTPFLLALQYSSTTLSVTLLKSFSTCSYSPLSISNHTYFILFLFVMADITPFFPIKAFKNNTFFYSLLFSTRIFLLSQHRSIFKHNYFINSFSTLPVSCQHTSQLLLPNDLPQHSSTDTASHHELFCAVTSALPRRSDRQTYGCGKQVRKKPKEAERSQWYKGHSPQSES